MTGRSHAVHGDRGVVITRGDDTELIVAGVVTGDVPLVDTDGETTGYTRFASVVDADSPDEAEQTRPLALTQAGTTES